MPGAFFNHDTAFSLSGLFVGLLIRNCVCLLKFICCLSAIVASQFVVFDPDCVFFVEFGLLFIVLRFWARLLRFKHAPIAMFSVRFYKRCFPAVSLFGQGVHTSSSYQGTGLGRVLQHGLSYQDLLVHRHCEDLSQKVI